MHPLKANSIVKKKDKNMKIARGIQNLMPKWGHYLDGCLKRYRRTRLDWPESGTVE